MFFDLGNYYQAYLNFIKLALFYFLCGTAKGKNFLRRQNMELLLQISIRKAGVLLNRTESFWIPHMDKYSLLAMDVKKKQKYHELQYMHVFSLLFRFYEQIRYDFHTNNSLK